MQNCLHMNSVCVCVCVRVHMICFQVLACSCQVLRCCWCFAFVVLTCHGLFNTPKWQPCKWKHGKGWPSSLAMRVLALCLIIIHHVSNHVSNATGHLPGYQTYLMLQNHEGTKSATGFQWRVAFAKRTVQRFICCSFCIGIIFKPVP